MQLGIFVCFHDDKLGVGRLTDYPRNQVYPHFLSPGGPVRYRGATARPWAARTAASLAAGGKAVLPGLGDPAPVTNTKTMAGPAWPVLMNPAGFTLAID